MTVVKGLIQKMAEVDAPVVRATVLTVDKNAYTCNVQTINDEDTIESVKLKPIINSGDPTQLGLVLFPAVGSIVTVCQVNGIDIDNTVIGYTQIESISMDMGTAFKFLLDATGMLTLNGGSNGGIPMASPLSTIIAKLQQQVNTLITTFNTHVHPVAGAATGPTATPGPGVTVQTIQPSDIANPKIKQ